MKYSFCTFLLLLFNGAVAEAQVRVRENVKLMGSLFDITIVEKDSSAASRRISEVSAEIRRIEELISEWIPDSEISEVNRNAGVRPVKVSPEVFDLTRRAITYSELSGGAFDISIIALDKIWLFDGSMTELPSPQQIRESVKNVGYRYIVLDSLASTIFLSRKGMKIGFGSIGKGYAADKGREQMKNSGVRGGIVNASGDLSAWGVQPDGKRWKIGINNPFKPHKVLKILPLSEASAATSGSYEKYAEINGKRYAHIIDPKTGYPSTGLTSVTITGPSAEFANALSTTVMVMGRKKGVRFLKQFPDYGYLLLSDKGRVHSSKLPRNK